MSTRQRVRLTRKVVANALRAVRERAGVSQERLAARAEVTRTYVGRVERGELRPTIDTMDRLLVVLNVTWAEFGAALHDARNG